MRKFAHLQVDTLLRRLSAQVKRTAQSADPDAVHDLRVAIRRLSRALRSFAQFFAGKSWKRIRKRLSLLMEFAGAVRDRDVALELLEKAGGSKRARLTAAWQIERRQFEIDLRAELESWQARKFARQWRKELEL
jgi:CHAD domain-containing protein